MMLDAQVERDLLSMYGRSRVPSDMLKYVLERHPEATVPDLMAAMRHAFELPYEDVQCIGGWWHDGSGELSDAELDARLIAAVERARGAPYGQ